VRSHRPYRSLLLTAFVSGSSLAAEPSNVSTVECTVATAKEATTAEVLMKIARSCEGDEWATAIARLFHFPLPEPPHLAFSPPVPAELAEQVTYELDVFYNLLQPYPPPEAFEKLNTLIDRLSKTFTLASISITGMVDRVEVRMEIASQLATARARRVQQYLLAAGAVPQSLIQVAVAEPIQPDSLEGRARDRVAKVKVVALRAKAGQ